MFTHLADRRVVVLLAVGFLAGCSNSSTAPSPSSSSNEEDAVRQVFTSFQEALKAKDAEKVWALLDDESREEAERAAQTIRDAYAKATPAEKADLEKGLGLPAADLAGVKGQGFLKTKRFQGKYDEVAESKVEKVTVQGDKATVNYVEPDGDKEKFNLVRQGGQWKLSVPMPKAN